MKKFTNSIEVLKREIEVLDTVKTVESVTKFRGQTSDPMSILVSPVGVHFLGADPDQDSSQCVIFRMYVCFFFYVLYYA